MIRFSIVIPVYNVEKYLRECIESVLSQSFVDYEIILVNDGSTDKSPEICEQYAKNNNRIKVIHKSNGGVSDSRNCGLLASIGEYIIFLDSDDYFTSECLSKIDNHINKYGRSDIIFASFMFYDEKSNSYYKKNNEYSVEELVEEGIDVLVNSVNKKTIQWVVFSSIFKRKLLIENKIIFENKVKAAEDLDFYLRAVLKAASFSSSNIYVCFYRVNRAGSATTNPDKNSLYCSLSIYKKWFDYFFKSALVLEDRDVLCKFFANAYISKISELLLIDKEERRDIVRYIYTNKEILRYSPEIKKKIKYYMINTFGVERGLSVFVVYYKIKGFGKLLELLKSSQVNKKVVK